MIVVLILAAGAQAQTTPDADELTRLLKEFLAGASRSDAAVHERFWADDLIYTGSAGRRTGKQDILRGLRPAPAPKADDPKTTYSAEDIRIQQYGDTAIVAFRLVGTTVTGGRTAVSNYLNSGTFLKRNGKWQVVNWQSTRMPRGEEESKKEAAAAQVAFHQALLVSDTKALEDLADETFIWTHRTGEQVARRELLEQLKSGQLKYSKMVTDRVAVSIYGDTAVVRGVSDRQRSAIPGSTTGDASPFTTFYTLTLVNRGGVWKAVALHTSRT